MIDIAKITYNYDIMVVPGSGYKQFQTCPRPATLHKLIRLFATDNTVTIAINAIEIPVENWSTDFPIENGSDIWMIGALKYVGPPFGWPETAAESLQEILMRHHHRKEANKNSKAQRIIQDIKKGA